MSYSICYQTLAYCYSKGDLISAANTWLEQQGQSISGNVYHDFERFTGITLPNHDVYTLMMEYGDSNFFDENDKPVRYWSSYGFHSEHHFIQNIGIKMSEQVASGELKPNNRWIKPESWVRRIRAHQKNAQPIGRLPWSIAAHFYDPLPTETEQLAYRSQVFEWLRGFDVSIKTDTYGGHETLKLTINPTSPFQWWFFCALSQPLRDKPLAIPSFDIER